MYQKITVVGNLGRDPEMKYLPDGTAVTNFSIAVSSWRNSAKATAWFRVSVFGKMAENCNQYLEKGKQVLVDGELDFDTETGNPKQFQKQDGTVGCSFEIRARDVKFLGGGTRHDDDEATGAAATAPTRQPSRQAETEDIPF